MGTIALSLPVSGLPNSTEDPKVTNDLTLIQNVINGGLDASNLSTTSGIMKLGVTVAASNYAANYGDLVNAAPGITVTLPAPRSNALVGVVAQGGTSGASPITVSGTNIYGVGLTAASSFKLGVPIAPVILQSDGTNWIIISGQQDTGWVAPSIGANITSTTIFVRKRGDSVTFRGAFLALALITAGATIMTLPAGFAPATTAIAIATSTFPNAPTSTAVQIGIGSLTVTTGQPIASGNTFLGEGLNYTLSA